MTEQERTKSAMLGLGALSPGSASAAHLVVLYPADLVEPRVGSVIDLGPSTVSIGRSGDATVSVDSEVVSRYHAEISFERGKYLLRDLGSKNGTQVNARPISSVALADGDLIQIGDVFFKFLSEESLEAGLFEQLYQIALYDPQTHALTRRYFGDLLQREVARAARLSQPASLAMIELDDLAKYYERAGRMAMDHLVVQVCEQVRAALQPEQMLGRWSDDTFVLFLPESDAEEASRLGERIRKRVESLHIEFQGQRYEITVSVGIVSTSGGTTDVGGLLAEATNQVKLAVRYGRNRVECAAQSGRFDDNAPPPLYTATALSEALFRKRLQTRQEWFVFGVSLQNRLELICRPDGKRLLHQLEGAVDAAAASVLGTKDIICELDEGGIRLVAVAGETSYAYATGLAERFEVAFGTELARRGLSPERLAVCRPVSCSGPTDLGRAVRALADYRNHASKLSLFPLPIALAIRSFGAQTDPNRRARGIVTIHECTVRWLVTLLLAETRMALRSGHWRPVSVIGNMLAKSPTLGEWIGLLRRASLLLRDVRGEEAIGKDIVTALHNKRGKPTDAGVVIERFVKDRNKYVHENLPAEELLNAWQPQLELLLERFAFLRELQPLVVLDVDLLGDALDDTPGFDFTILRLVGDHLEIVPEKLIHGTPLRKGMAYVEAKERGIIMPLDPLVVHEATEASGTLKELVFLESAIPTYKTFRTGAVLGEGHDLCRGRASAVQKLLREL